MKWIKLPDGRRSESDRGSVRLAMPEQGQLLQISPFQDKCSGVDRLGAEPSFVRVSLQAWSRTGGEIFFLPRHRLLVLLAEGFGIQPREVGLRQDSSTQSTASRIESRASAWL